MPHKDDIFKGFTTFDDVPAFAVSSAQIENFSDYQVSRKEPSPSHKAENSPKAEVNSFIGRLREQRAEAARRPEGGHYL